MKVMVTGGTGFIGSYVVAALVAANHEVRILARDPGKVAGFVGQRAITFTRGDLAEEGAYVHALHGADACVHIARVPGTTAPETILGDTLAAARLFEGGISAGVEQIIYTSSVSVFDGRADRLCDNSPPRPLRVYGASKAAAEAFLLGMTNGAGVRANVVRPGYTFGEPVVCGAPTQSMSEIPSMVRAALRGEQIRVVKDSGLQYIWAGDLAKLYLALLESAVDRRQYIALARDFHTWEEVARWTVEQSKSKSEVEVIDVGEVLRGATLKEGVTPWDVSGIENDFGLAFSAEAHLRRHIDFWVERLRRE